MSKIFKFFKHLCENDDGKEQKKKITSRRKNAPGFISLYRYTYIFFGCDKYFVSLIKFHGENRG